MKKRKCRAVQNGRGPNSRTNGAAAPCTSSVPDSDESSEEEEEDLPHVSSKEAMGSANVISKFCMQSGNGDLVKSFSAFKGKLVYHIEISKKQTCISDFCCFKGKDGKRGERAMKTEIGERDTGRKKGESDIGGEGEGSDLGGEGTECMGSEDDGPSLTFQPTSLEWRVRQCSRLGFPSPLDMPERDASEELGMPCQRNVIVGDGNCLYRALSLEVCGTQAHHTQIKEMIVDIMCQDQEKRFSGYVGNDLGDYLNRNTLRPRSWGSDVEIFAVATLLQTTIFVYTVISETSRKWLPHPPLFSIPGVERSVQNIYLSNLCGHFERVVKVSNTAA